MRRFTLLLTLLVLTLSAADRTGPWDLAALRQPPQVTLGDERGLVRSLYYTGEPFQGKPTRVFAYYGLPQDRQGKVPAMVLVHGGGGTAFKEWAEMWAGRGYAAIAMDLRGRGPDGQRRPDGGPEQDNKFIFENISNGVRETWPYHAAAAVIRAVSFLAAQPEVDARRIGITGISWGGYLTSMVSGLDDRLKVAIPVYGCGFIYQNSPWSPIIDKLPERALWIENFDPSQYLPQARMPMLWVNGTNDFAYGLDNYQKSYHLPRGPRTLSVTVRMKHSHPDGWKPAEIGLFADQCLRKGKPLPQLGAPKVKGKKVEAPFRSKTGAASASLAYTTDGGAWKDRFWQSTEADIGPNRILAELPAARPIVFFLTLTDSRGATVSTEHQELEK